MMQWAMKEHSDPNPEMGPDTSQYIADGWVDIATEAMWYLAGRMTSDQAYQAALVACDDIAEIEKLQVAFLKSAIRDYACEMREASRIMRAVMVRRASSQA